MTGRARGKARGRARGTTDDASQRPGETAAPPPQQVHGNGNGGPPPASGRASYRGGARESKPGMAGGEGMRAPADEMARLSMGGGDGRGDRRRTYGEEPRTRPAHITDKSGTSGQPIPLKTNYFGLEQAPDWHLYQYHVDYNPDIEFKKTRIGLLYHHEELLGKTKAFDGMTLYLPHKLQDNVTEVFSERRSDSAKVKITIKLTNELPPNSPQCIQVYNIIFRRVLAAIEMQQIGRNYYNPAQQVTIPQHKLCVMPGFVTSILQYESNVLLNCDISHKILRSDTVLDIMYDMYARMGDNFYDACTRKLVGTIIMTRYNNKTYRVDDICWDMHPTDSFELRDKSKITYKEYYQKHYELNIADDQQPLLVSKPKPKDIRRGMKENLYFIPELCTLTGLSDDARADFTVMKDVAVHTRVAPSSREQTLTGFISQINRNEKVRVEMGGWGLKFTDSLVTLSARVMPQEKIFQQNGELNYKQEDADWSRDMRGKRLITPVNLQNWVVIFFRRNNQQAQEFVQTLSRVGPPMGMMINNPQPVELQDDRNDSYLTALRQNIGPQTQMVMCIVPTNKKDRYDAIKKFTCVDHPVPSQVIVSRTLSKKQMMMSVATKVAIQLNCKMGGEVWALEIPLKNMMVVGIDSYHDSAKKGRSVGGVIASMNQALTRYYSRCTFQHSMQELLDGLKVCFKGALEKFHEVNNCLPERIIVFRDGVGDGQLPTVYEHEVPQMLDAFKAAGGQNYNPRVGVVVVKKRINSRFFARAGQGLGNPPPGTVIDNTVTKPEWYDFFLVSQCVRQGTVTPTHYNIIHDNTGLKPDHMQRLTYKLCHLYYNWPGTIRVPAPCQYAHKLAFLVGQSIHKDPALELSDKLYFL
ncbi:PIWL1-like protein [Mya arenaria]|uniref:PIWL1-like protein n=1 Tax=Mya arenaria TaxID=6604 RepID=A0ABY7E5Q8_MYAAR|nr:PIWL1-like protein [Mya arenaria]